MFFFLLLFLLTWTCLFHRLRCDGMRQQLPRRHGDDDLLVQHIRSIFFSSTLHRTRACCIELGLQFSDVAPLQPSSTDPCRKSAATLAGDLEQTALPCPALPWPVPPCSAARASSSSLAARKKNESGACKIVEDLFRHAPHPINRIPSHHSTVTRATAPRPGLGLSGFPVHPSTHPPTCTLTLRMRLSSSPGREIDSCLDLSPARPVTRHLSPLSSGWAGTGRDRAGAATACPSVPPSTPWESWELLSLSSPHRSGQ